MNTPVLSRWRLTVSRANSGAFTSLELLVVIAALVVLSAILLPALATSKERDIRVVCVNNEKQLYASLQMYGDDNGDKLPQLVGAGSWAFDVPTSVTGAMTNYGCLRKTFYCPSTGPRFTDQQNWASANSLWNYAGGSLNIVGYTFAFGGINSKIDPQYQNSTLLRESHPNGPLVVLDNPDTREVIADVILSNGSFLPATGANNFISIIGGFTQNGVSYPHLSAHLTKGLVPSGGNIAFKDGHVQWRKFAASSSVASANNTKVRTTSGPYFWW